MPAGWAHSRSYPTSSKKVPYPSSWASPYHHLSLHSNGSLYASFVSHGMSDKTSSRSEDQMMWDVEELVTQGFLLFLSIFNLVSIFSYFHLAYDILLLIFLYYCMVIYFTHLILFYIWRIQGYQLLSHLRLMFLLFIFIIFRLEITLLIFLREISLYLCLSNLQPIVSLKLKDS